MSAAADPAEEKNAKDEVRWRFKPRQLDITWGGDSKYWKMPAEGTDGPAELLDVVWLEINGSTPKPLPKGKRYALSFKISMADYDPVWKTYPVYMLAKVGKKGTSNWEKINLGELRVGDIVEIPSGKLRFEVPEKAKDTVLYFGLYELWSGEWKQGLRIHEAVVEEMPKSIVLS
ncbi:PROTEIN PHLOEM PROTEIN 2-LIKE A9 [Salix purpurea]|uniref:PROTEIN PHLOEM PROTEIN 2-LIKE A9 n=1 Tax=Salix purpurea TaxID=77065 RepID=A0A9Q0W5N5_SALPP|nr:PROTEIN PHLOEM PROTEIN 2-LIKE A9 [Salix purpurea]